MTPLILGATITSMQFQLKKMPQAFEWNQMSQTKTPESLGRKWMIINLSGSVCEHKKAHFTFIRRFFRPSDDIVPRKKEK